MRVTASRLFVIATFAIALSFTAAASSHAQRYASGPGPRWHAWLGCWSAAPADTSRFLSPTPARIVCVAPTTDADVVDISAIADGKLVSRDRIDASGRPRTVDVSGCTGSESARWSADQRRVFLQSSVVCEGVRSDMSAVLAINTQGEWLDVRSTAAGGGANIRVARYRDVGIPDGVPQDIATALGERRMSSLAARLAAGAPVGSSAIIEASHLVDGAIVEEWVRASGQRFVTDARSLTELADAGVPARVTDAMIAVSNRTVFAERYDEERYRYGRGSCGFYGCYGRQSTDAWDQGTGQRVYITVVAYDPWGFGYWPFGRRFYDRGFLGYAPYGYAPYGYAPHGYGGGWGYGYGDSYRGRAGSGYVYPPTIVLHANPGGTEPRGRAERGNGYTQGERPARPPMEPPVRRTAEPRTAPVPSERVAPAPTPSQPSGGSRSSDGDHAGNSAPRTAKARP